MARSAPKVGIFYVVNNKLWIEATPLAEAERFGEFAIHEHDHIAYWADLVKSGRVPRSEYEEYPRGRVAYNTRTATFLLLADRCILSRKGVVSKILRRLRLPPKVTETGADSHYRCYRCSGLVRSLVQNPCR